MIAVRAVETLCCLGIKCSSNSVRLRIAHVSLTSCIRKSFTKAKKKLFAKPKRNKFNVSFPKHHLHPTVMHTLFVLCFLRPFIGITLCAQFLYIGGPLACMQAAQRTYKIYNTHFLLPFELCCFFFIVGPLVYRLVVSGIAIRARFYVRSRCMQHTHMQHTHFQ